MGKIFRYITSGNTFRRCVCGLLKYRIIGGSRKSRLYGRGGFREMLEPTPLVCIAPEYQPSVRPECYLSKILFDINHNMALDIVPIIPGRAVRNAFRHYTALMRTEQLRNTDVAPANGHREEAAARNSASALLLKIATSLQGWFIFSLSGSDDEMAGSHGGYRAYHTLADYNHQCRRDTSIVPIEALGGPPGAKPTIILAVDSFGHCTPMERATLLHMGCAVLCSLPSPYMGTSGKTNEAFKSRITYFENGKLRSKVRGGGDYTDLLLDLNHDIMTTIGPDGDVTLSTVDTWTDQYDHGHVIAAIVPFARVNRRSWLYSQIRKAPKIESYKPTHFTNKHGSVNLDFTALRIAHSDTVQITNNTDRQTEYYFLHELSTIAPLTSPPLIKRALSTSKIKVHGVERNTVTRANFISKVGTNNIMELYNAVSVTIPALLAENKYSAALALIRASILQDQFEETYGAATVEARALYHKYTDPDHDQPQPVVSYLAELRNRIGDTITTVFNKKPPDIEPQNTDNSNTS